MDDPAIEELATKATKAIKDAMYVSVGLGVLAVQRANIELLEVRKRLAAQETGAGSVSLEAKVDTVIEHLCTRLPEPAGDLVHHARTVAKAAGSELWGMVNQTASPNE